MPWTAADIQDLHGRVAIVTGSSTGVGYAIALELAKHGAQVIVASRDEARTTAAAASIAAAVPDARVRARVLDLASLASVRRFADGVARECTAVDVLVNNAGVSGGPRRETADGFEVHFQVNYLAHFALTAQLLPLLRARPGARVVSISSDVASSGRIDFDDLQSTHTYDFVKAYAQSKLANLLFAFELQRRCAAGGAGVASLAAHPGVAKSSILVGRESDWGRGRRGVEHVVRFVQWVLGQPAALAALPALYQATAPTARPEDYVGPRGFLHGRGYPGPVEIPERARDLDVAKRLWETSERLAGTPYRHSLEG
jgi:NAD(P)-dependent dehydrogenase (short-subunit alcohol dehydrogenase family)